jgi:hypothetical protein
LLYISAACAKACPCPADGVDIALHAETDDCPKGYFANPDKLKAERRARRKRNNAVDSSIKPLLFALWPEKVKRLALKRRPADRGFGDTQRWRYARWGGEIYKSARKAIKLPCKCEATQARLNATYPYPPPGGWPTEL